MSATIRQPMEARGGGGHPGRRLLLALGLALAGGCAHGTVAAPAADGPAAKAETSPDEATEELLDGPRWQYDRYFEDFVARVRHNWSHERVAQVLAAERPGRAANTVVLRVVLLTHGRLRHVGVEKPSGSSAYDELAVHALDASQPFAPPGPELARDGLLSFRLEVCFDARTGKTTFRASTP
jgi:TonB family protein